MSLFSEGYRMDIKCAFGFAKKLGTLKQKLQKSRLKMDFEFIAAKK